MAAGNRTLTPLAAGLLVGGLIGWAGLFSRADLAFFDLLQRRLLRPPPSQVSIVEIDAGTVERLGWPIGKDLYAGAVEALHAAGAVSIGIDIFFTDRELPAAGGDNLAAPGFEEALGLAAAGSGAVLATYRIETDRPETLPTETARHRPPACPDRDPSVLFKPLLPGLRRDGVAIGHVHIEPSEDGVFRSVIPCLPDRDGCLSDLGSTMIGRPPYSARCREQVVVPALRRFSDMVRMPLGELILATGEPDGMARLTTLARGRHVLIGLTDPTLADFGATPWTGREPLVALHANRIDALLAGIEIRPLPPEAFLALSILAGIGLGLGVRRGWLRLLLALGAVPIGVAGSAGLFSIGLFWIPPSALALPACAGLLAAGIAAVWREQLDERLLSHAFESYVSPDVHRWLKATGWRALDPRAAERREISVLFSDVAGFTSLSNSLEPGVIRECLGRYLSAMERIVTARNGYIDKINGDGLMIQFGAPLARADHAALAVASALEMQAAVTELNPEWRRLTGRDLIIRVGIASGPAFVGNLGSTGHIEYTAIGRDVNLAARLEKACEPGGVLLSERTVELLPERPPGAWREVTAKGYDRPVRAWQIGNGTRNG